MPTRLPASSDAGVLRLLLGCLAALFGGAAALGYEVAWSKLLVVPLGNSADATAIVLAAFMLGMALGSALLGRLADSRRRGLRIYAMAELALAAYALAAPWLLHRLVYLNLWESSPALAQIARLGAAALLVALPSAAMGAALPLLLRALASGSVARMVGLVYGANTLGAALGALVAGYVAIPSLGLSATSALAASMSALCAVLALLADLVPERAQQTATPAVPQPASGEATFAWFGLLAAATCGAVTMGAEVVWARLLTFVFGHDTYAFAALLTVVLLGLSLGGAVFHFAGRRAVLRFAVVACAALGATLLIGLWATAAVVLGKGRDPLNLTQTALGASLWLELALELVFTPILVGLSALASGALFPAAIALAAPSGTRTGTRVGLALLVNGAAGAIGSLTVSFFLIAAFGLSRSLLALAVLALSTSAVGLVAAARQGISRPRLLALCGALLPGLILVAVLPANLPRAMLHHAVGARHQELTFYEEGRTSTVSITVNKINGEKQLFVNAVNEVTTRLVHVQSFKLLGHLGPLFHPRPKKALMICLGAGLAAGAALTHPLSSLEIAELSSTVPKATRLWAKENHHALDDPMTQLVIADGRHALASTRSRYDVIIVDSTHPKSVDSWLLYTAEFYELARSRLTPEGLLVQWVPLHGLSERELKILVRTFHSVFPETTLWANIGYEIYGTAAYLKLVGSRQSLLVDYAELELRLKEPRIADDLRPYGMDSPVEILDTFLANPEAVAEWTKGLPIQTDDRPIVPFITRYTSGRRMEAPLLLAVRVPVWGVVSLPGDRADALAKELSQAYDASGFLLAGLLEQAASAYPGSHKIPLYLAQAEASVGYYQELAKLYADDADKLFEIGSYLGNLGASKESRELFERALRLDPQNLRVRLNLALTHLDLGEAQQARDQLERLAEGHPNHPLVLYNLGVARQACGDPTAALEPLYAALAQLGELPGVRLALGRALLDLGQRDEAKALLDDLVVRNPFDAAPWDLLGLVAAAEGDYETARARHIRALTLEPYRRDSHFNLGLALSALGRLAEAAEAFSTCLRLDPKDADAAYNLDLVRGKR